MYIFLLRNRQKSFTALKLTEDNKQPLWGINYRLLRSLQKIVNTFDQT